MPDPIEAAVAKIATLAGVTVTPGQNAWRILLPERAGLQLEVDVPREVLEWYARIQTRDGNELWSAWMDYYEHGSVERAALPLQMAEDLMWFAMMICTATSLRMRRRRVFWLWHQDHLEWEVEGRWQRAHLFKTSLA